MGKFGGYYFGEKKKPSKKILGKRSKKLQVKYSVSFKLPELIKKK